MANGTEYIMDGGVYWMGMVEDNADRSDIYLQESGPGKNAAEGMPLTLTLRIVTGSGEMVLSGVLPQEMKRIGEFLRNVSGEIMHRERIVT